MTVAEVRYAALCEAAERIDAELICCDAFDLLSEKPSSEWSDQDREDYRRHSICYWGEAARRIVLNLAAATSEEDA